MAKNFSFVGLMKAGKFPPQMDLVKKYGSNRNFNFQIVNTKEQPVRVRMFGTLTDYVSVFSAGAISVTKSRVNTLTDAEKKQAMNYYFQYPDPYESGNTFLEDLATYLRNGGDKVLNLPSTDFTTTPSGGIEAEVPDPTTFYRPEDLWQWLLQDGGMKKIPVTLGMLFSRGVLGGLAQISPIDYINGTLGETDVVTDVTADGGGQQQGALPFVVDGNFADGLTAVSSGQPIKELWSYILYNGALVMKALQVSGSVENMVQQNIVLKEKSPFKVPGDVVFALSKWQNPYVVNAHMGLADNINIMIGKNNYLEFDVFPGTNNFSMFF